MNTNPKAKRILCYGDSNTWGQKPDKSGRYSANVRWTGVAQNILGDDYEIIEEGLGGRTVNLDNPDRIGRNGKAYLAPCLQSHNPLDIVIIMLGTNDLKMSYETNAKNITLNILGLVDDINQYANAAYDKKPQVIIMSPIHINPDAPRFAEFYTDSFATSSGEESKKLSAELSALARDNKIEFIDAAMYAQAGEDGLHLSLGSCQTLGQEVAKKIAQHTTS